MPLYEQVYLYADRISPLKQRRGESVHRVSTPKMLSKFAPVAPLIKRARSVQRSNPRNKLARPQARHSLGKSTFQPAANFAGTDPSEPVDAAHDAMDSRSPTQSPRPSPAPSPCSNPKPQPTVQLEDEPPPADEPPAQTIKSIQVNSNDLHWHKPVTMSKDTGLLQGREFDPLVVRLPQVRKPSHFAEQQDEAIPKLQLRHRPDDEELKEGGQEVSPWSLPRSPMTPITPITPMTPNAPSGAILCRSPKSPTDRPVSVLYSECGQVCEGGDRVCPRCQEKQPPIDISGPLYTSIAGEIKRCWCRLLNKDLYCTPKDDV